VSDTRIFTVGHATRSLDELIALLHTWGVHEVVDVRTVPRSRHNPQFNTDTLGGALAARELGYRRAPALGGLRRARSVDPTANDGWENESFRNYADYALSPPFEDALDALVALSRAAPCAIMCAEAVWWRCHRRIIADHLLARSVPVAHILSLHRADPATLTPFARVEAHGQVRYPSTS
jgi:uncharacterized protein (DUF488 family)